jgi:hypothetical protein
MLSLLLLPGVAHASFEIEPLSPQQRGAATHLALGMVEGLFDPSSSGREDSTYRAGIGVYGFCPFGISEIEFAAIWAAIPLGKARRELSFSYQRLEVLTYNEETYRASCAACFGNLWYVSMESCWTGRYWRISVCEAGFATMPSFV